MSADTYAIILLGGKQYRVTEGETITVDRIPEESEATELKLSEVLLVKTAKTTKVGQPYVDGATVTLERVADGRGPKLEIYKYKAKSRYRRHTGHRQEQTTLNVRSISA